MAGSCISMGLAVCLPHAIRSLKENCYGTEDAALCTGMVGVGAWCMCICVCMSMGVCIVNNVSIDDARGFGYRWD